MRTCNGGRRGKALRASDINPDFYVDHGRVKMNLFPWDFIGHRIAKAQLWREYQEALTEEQS